MGSLEEEKLLQMVHDFIESSDSSSSSSLSPNYHSTPNNHPHHVLHSSRFFSLQEMLRKKTGGEKEVMEKVGKYMKNKMEMEKTTKVKQWIVKCLNLEGFHASLSHTSWITTPSCPSGNYEYIEVVEEDEAKGGLVRIIVDIDFKSQFEVARPTQSYTELSNKLPMIFVGREDKLNKIISLLCSAAQDSLRERGLHIPPWRRVSYMKSKWNLSTSYSYNNNNNIITYPTTTTTTNNNNNNNNFDYYYPTKSNNNNDDANLDYPSNKIKKWAPQNVMMKGRKELGSSGSRLSNQFSNLSINCC